ncbi:MAG: DUF1178 family protein [Azovibrio sp.]|nr:DUF1178 family protein [Azovibrio sp.]
MIIFDLSCDAEHRFEGWFASHADFETQQTQGLVRCPYCDSRVIRRVPSVSHLVTPRQGDAAQAHAGPPPQDPVDWLRRLGEVIRANSEDVGRRFAEDARRIHYAEAPARAIRGQATREEFLELRDEGIEVVPLPIAVDPDKLN